MKSQWFLQDEKDFLQVEKDFLQDEKVGIRGAFHNGKDPGQAGLGVGKPKAAWLLRIWVPEKVPAVGRGWGQARVVRHSPGSSGEQRTSLGGREYPPPVS